DVAEGDEPGVVQRFRTVQRRADVRLVVGGAAGDRGHDLLRGGRVLRAAAGKPEQRDETFARPRAERVRGPVAGVSRAVEAGAPLDRLGGAYDDRQRLRHDGPEAPGPPQ